MAGKTGMHWSEIKKSEPMFKTSIRLTEFQNRKALSMSKKAKTSKAKIIEALLKKILK